MIWHVVERSLIHLFSAMGLVVCVFFAIQSLYRRYSGSWLPANVGGRLLLSGMIVFALTVLREAVDVSNGQPLPKAFADYLSWAVGIGLGIWATYRLVWLDWEN